MSNENSVAYGYNIQEDEEDTSIFGNIANWTNPLFILLVIAIVLWILFRNNQPLDQIGRYDSWIMWLFIGITIFNTGKALLKLMSPQLVSDPVHTSTLGYPAAEIGMFSIYTLNDIYMLNIRGKKGAIIVPSTAVENKGRNVSINTPLYRIIPEKVPHSISQELFLRGFRPPFWRGYVDGIISREDPQVQNLIAEVDNSNISNNARQCMINSHLKTFEDFNSSISRNMQIKRDGMFGRIREAIKGGDNK
jgi:hypothetical protein